MRPRVQAEDGLLPVRRGVVGLCRLFGMDGYLREYVVWSARPMVAVEVHADRSLGEPMPGPYIEEMTCTKGTAYRPILEAASVDRHENGSITVHTPRIHNGPGVLPIVSGHVGACRLLGYDAIVRESLRWSARRSAGVALARDGQIYDRTSGTVLVEMGCTNGKDR